jgi:hypothetical protein
MEIIEEITLMCQILKIYERILPDKTVKEAKVKLAEIYAFRAVSNQTSFWNKTFD